MGNKVFCKNCTHYELRRVSGYGMPLVFWEKCHHPKYKEQHHNYEQEWETEGDPGKINKNNDCKLFSQKIICKSYLFGLYKVYS